MSGTKAGGDRKIATPNDTEAASEWRRYIHDFLTFLAEEKGASANTVAAYRNDLQQLAEFIGTLSGAAGGQSLSPSMIRDFILDLKQRGYTETSVARKVAAVRSFFAFLSAEGTIPANPTEGLSPRAGKTLPRTISPNELDELLEQPSRRATPEAKRDRALIELLYATGMRITEMVSLDLSDVNLDPRSPYVRYLGQGAKERTVPIRDEASEALAEYLEEGRPFLVRNRGEPALFVNRRGERLTRPGFWLILKGYAKAANLSAEITPHTLRNSLATHMLRGGMPLRNVADMLGHPISATAEPPFSERASAPTTGARGNFTSGQRTGLADYVHYLYALADWVDNEFYRLLKAREISSSHFSVLHARRHRGSSAAAVRDQLKQLSNTAWLPSANVLFEMGQPVVSDIEYLADTVEDDQDFYDQAYKVASAFIRQLYEIAEQASSRPIGAGRRQDPAISRPYQV